MAHFGTSVSVLGCVIGIGLLALVGACDDGAAVAVRPSACLEEFPRGDAPVTDETTIDEAITECNDDDGACQASVGCTGSVEGRECSVDDLISADAAECIAAEAGLEAGLSGLQGSLTYNARYRRIVWDVSNTLFDRSVRSDAAGESILDKGGESIAVDAISGETYEVLEWQAISSIEPPL